MGAKREPKTIKNRFKIRSKFQSDFGMVIGTFFVNFGSVLGSLNPQKWSSRLGEVLFLRKSRFLAQMRFWIDFLLLFYDFGHHLGEYFGIKIASKNRSRNQSDFGSIFAGFWRPI